MNCAVHAETPATGFCRNCGTPLCGTCTREVRGALYCEPCLAGLVATPAVPAAAPAGVPHPGAALALGFIPGLGAVYNGEYLKALIHIVIFAGLISGLSQNISVGYNVFLSIALACFYFYMPIEAYRTAKAREREKPASGPGGTVAAVEPTADHPAASAAPQRPTGAIVLIAIGVFLLLANFGMLQWDWLGKGWPFILIILGVWLLADRIKARV